MPATPETTFGPWNPGINSTIPGRLMPHVTLFDPAHSFVEWHQAQDLSEMIGLKPLELAITRPERLALHSVLIRVTSQLYVPDGPNYADLGISLRRMAAQIYDGFVLPEMAAISAEYDSVRDKAAQTINDLLDAEIYAPEQPQTTAPAGLLGWLKKRPEPTASPPDTTARAMELATRWKDEHNTDILTASRRAIARTLGATLNARGRLLVDRETIQSVATGLVLNRLGSAAVGQVVDKLFLKAAKELGFRTLPPQSEPVVLNAKGASASGKSSIRPMQRDIATRLGVDWQDFAIISPDYWRKALIAYDDLGDDTKYAAMLCGQELEVIDRKLDILMAVKGREGSVPHMLIDRFRFDSFQTDRAQGEDSKLLTRFGSKVYLFFIVTPPAATVERAWIRGLETGRFKAVDDLLYHNIEAYTGMPDLFFNWANGRGKWVHYEFLDNSVARGETPKTIAFGKNGRLVITDLDRLCDIDRFRDVDVDAEGPDSILPQCTENSDAMPFVRRAMAELSRVEILVPGSDQIFARSVNGQIELESDHIPATINPGAFGAFQKAVEPLGRYDGSERSDVIGA